MAKLYEGYSQRDDFNIYSRNLQRIPRPKCICFYNGVDKQNDKSVLKLSSMYFENTKKAKEEISGIVELEVIMININYGHNKELLEKCSPLYEYSFFVDRIRFHIDAFKRCGKNFTLEDAINKAIEDLPKDFKILKFILANKAEVTDMCLFEYDEEKHMRSEREEGRKEGIEKNMLELLRDGLLEKKVVAEKLGISIADVEKKLNNL